MRTPAQHVVHLRLSDFAVGVERRDSPALIGRPVVIGGRPGGPGCVVAASAEARALGVVPGLTFLEAARRCPGATFLPGDLERYLQARADLHVRLIDVVDPIEWVGLAEIYAIAREKADEASATCRAAEAAQAALHDALGVGVAMGVATSKVVARAASSLVTPPGLLIVLPGYEARFLSALDLSCLEGIDASARDRLRAAGIETVGALAALDWRSALDLLGRSGGVLVRLARGEDDRVVLPGQRRQPPAGVASAVRRVAAAPTAYRSPTHRDRSVSDTARTAPNERRTG